MGLFVMLAIYAAVIFVIIAGMWKVFTKAGQPGWYSIIPILNTYTLIKIARRPGWWLLLMFIPCVSFVVAIIVMMDLAKAFGKDSGFGIGLALLAPIFIPILGFGSATYDDGFNTYTPSYGGTGGGYGGTGGGFGGAGSAGGWGGTPAPGGFNPTGGVATPPAFNPTGGAPTPPASNGLPGLGLTGDSAPAEAAASAGDSTPAGWYPDPSGTGQRWWDGTAWTDNTAP